jgi:hypothetical protein
MMIPSAAYFGIDVLGVGSLDAREADSLGADWFGPPEESIVILNRPVHILVVRGHRVQRLGGVQFTVCECFLVWATTELADGTAGGLGRCDGAFYSICNIGRCSCSACEVERVSILEGDADFERLTCFACGSWASESTVGISMLQWYSAGETYPIARAIKLRVLIATILIHLWKMMNIAEWFRLALRE